MARSTLFTVAASKLERAEQELRQLDTYLDDYARSGLRNEWSRTATIAFTIHGIYSGMEDVMSDLARDIDDHVPQGGTSHQALLDQMRVALDGRRPALLDERLYRNLAELEAFRHVVRHHYGVALIPDKTNAKLDLIRSAFLAFKSALARLEQDLTAE